MGRVDSEVLLPVAGGGESTLSGSLNPLRYAHDLIAPGLGGRRVFTVLLPDVCRYACAFCPMSAVRRLPEAFRTPSGLGRLFMTAFRRGLCDGLFVTAGLPRNPVKATARMLDFVESLRVHHGYRGYIHVKAVPGAEPGQMQRLVRLADRISYHLEPACRRALLENPTGHRARGLELYSTPDQAAGALRSALRESARRAPGPLPPARDAAFGGTDQLALFGGRTSSRSESSARR